MINFIIHVALMNCGRINYSVTAPVADREHQSISGAVVASGQVF